MCTHVHPPHPPVCKLRATNGLHRACRAPPIAFGIGVATPLNLYRGVDLDNAFRGTLLACLLRVPTTSVTSASPKRLSPMQPKHSPSPTPNCHKSSVLTAKPSTNWCRAFVAKDA